VQAIQGHQRHSRTPNSLFALRGRNSQLQELAERFVRSIKEECLERMIFIGQVSLRRAIAEYMAHFHEERNHQGLGNRLIRRKQVIAANDAAIHRRNRLGGMLSYYHCVAA
jgi:putative transposase